LRGDFAKGLHKAQEAVWPLPADGHSTKEKLDTLIDVAISALPPFDLFLADISNLKERKRDWALPDALRRKVCASIGSTRTQQNGPTQTMAEPWDKGAGREVN
jgi:hypothetical protein